MEEITLNREAKVSLMPTPKRRCTVIESMQGEVKLIQQIDQSYPELVTLHFSDLKNCLEYVAKNEFHIATIYSGRRKNDRERKEQS
jgi:hypothetical protein